MIGQTISHYRITDKIGAGGMGVVYKAEDTKLHRPVALKFLPPELTRDKDARQRFIQEARAASSLDHPNICTIYEINEDAAGRSFISMAYYDGQTLKQRLEEGPLPFEQARDILVRIGEGLSKAHQSGIIHRDIKPANIFLTSDGLVKILDFGIAKLSGHSQLTKTGSTVGTMAYMAPEQIQGNPVDQRTDLWALGVIFYEMLTGTLPFQGEYEQALMYSILAEPPRPIGKDAALPDSVVRILFKCLEKNPDHRYASIASFIEELAQPAATPGTDSPQIPQPHSPTRFLSIPPRAKPILLAGTGLAILLVVLLAFRRTPVGHQPEGRLTIAITDFENNTGEPELEGLSGLFITALEQSRYLSVLTRSRMFDLLKQMGKQPVDRIDEPLGHEIARYANIHAMVFAKVRKFDQIYTIELNVIDPILDEYLFTTTARGKTKSSIPGLIDRLAEETRQGLQEKNAQIQRASKNVAQLTTPNLEAYQHYFQGEEHINRLEFQNAIREFQQAIALDSTFGLAYARLAYVYWWLSPIEGFREESMRNALAHLDRIPEKDRYLLRAQALIMEGGDYKDALPVLKQGVELYPQEKELIYNLGDYAYHALELRTSITFLEKTLQMDPTHDRALQHLTWAYREIGNPVKMNEYAREYVNATGSAEAYNLLAESYLILNDLQEAISLASNQIALNSGNVKARLTLGSAYIFADRIREGFAAFDSAAVYAKDDTYLEPQVYQQRAAAYAYLGQYHDSDASYRQAFELVNRNGAKYMYQEKLVHHHRVLGYNQFVRGNYQEALAEFQQALAVQPDARWVLRDIGVTFARMGRFTDARAIADTLITHNLNEPDHYYYYLMANIALEDGQLSQAKQYFEQSTKDNDARHLYYLPLVNALANSGETEAAIRLLEEMLQTRGCCYLGLLFHHSSWLYYPYGLYTLGTLYEQAGKIEPAIQKYRQVLEIWKNADDDIPQLHQAKERLAKLEASVWNEQAISSADRNS